jgi:hypothetical protein
MVAENATHARIFFHLNDAMERAPDSGIDSPRSAALMA